VVADLACVELSADAVNVAATDDFAALRDSYSMQCDRTCKGSFDALNPPNVARCRQGTCRAEAESDGG